MTKILTWKAIYNDGTFLRQCNADEKTINKYPDIDRSKLVAFELYDSNKLIFRMDLDPGQKLIFRRRVTKGFSGNVLGVVYIVGWHQNIDGKSIKKIAFVFEDGHVEFKPDWEKNSKWHYSPNLIECEK